MRLPQSLRGVAGRIALASLAASGLALAVEAVGVLGVGASTFQRLMIEHGATAELAHAMFDESVTRVVMVTTLIALLVSLGLAIAVARAVTRPLERVARAARRLAEGNYGVRVDRPAAPELASLADSFNQMAAGLEDQERLRRDLISNFAHELRTPLTNLRGYLRGGKNLILTPGIYMLDQPIRVTRPDTVVLGLGFPTLIPTNGNPSMMVASAGGMLISGLLFDAGAIESPVLLRVGNGHAPIDNGASDPTVLSDVFFRIGGAAAGKATTSLVVNSDNVILDDIWAWRADHGNGVGWTTNTADTGVIVNGDNVTAYGLFVEHYQKYEVIWNGNGGTDVFFQNEMPYDVPSQAAWMEAPGVDGYAAFKVADRVTSFSGYGMGSYSFFNQGVNIYAARAFEVPSTLPAGSLHDLLTIFLDPSHGKGGILHVVNDTGGSSTIANPDTPVTVVTYP